MRTWQTKWRSIAAAMVVTGLVGIAFQTGRMSGMQSRKDDTERVPLSSLDAVRTRLWLATLRPEEPTSQIGYPVSFVNPDVAARTRALKEDRKPTGHVSIPNGMLGRPFGTIVSIQGEPFESKRSPGSNRLTVTHVNGEPVDKPFLLRVEGKDVSDIAGTQIIGYETGGMGGTPLQVDIGPRSQCGRFGFHCKFVVVAPEKIRQSASRGDGHGFLLAQSLSIGAAWRTSFLLPVWWFQLIHPIESRA